MAKPKIGFLLWGRQENERDAFTDEKYKALADYLLRKELSVQTITFNNMLVESAIEKAAQCDALLVWVNPIEDGQNREVLDQMLERLMAQGKVVSCQPETIQRIGTKRVLYETRDMPWGSDVRLHETFDAFRDGFKQSLLETGVRVLKQFRGDGGTGVYKVFQRQDYANPIGILHAKRGSAVEICTFENAVERFKPYFSDGRPVIDQEWHEGMANGVVRCYLSGGRVAGFGYQEINAMYPSEGEQIAPSRRYYFTEKCGLFRDLKEQMEESWLQFLSKCCNVSFEELPAIWDCDFFINDDIEEGKSRYKLCEINVSCVSPFPESAIPHIYNAVMRLL